MDEALQERVWTTLADRFGDNLRGVTRYDPPDYRTTLREDLRGRYSKAEDREIVDETIITQMNLNEQEKRVKAGTLQGFVSVFEEAWLLNWPDPRDTKSGFIVALQRESEGTSMSDVEWCIQYLEGEIAPLID